MNKQYILEINGEMLDLGSTNLDVRLNNRRFDPILNKTVESEYSFSFEIPATPKNNKIFNYADNLSKQAKFNYKYPVKLYVDEILIFEGHLIITSYSYSSKTYKVNLVVVKAYDAGDMFGSHVLSDLVWEVDYQGAQTINAINAADGGKYKFPLVSYGKFQKVPYFTDDVASDYTSNFIIDDYNRWWHNSFPPSLNMLETMKRLFEQFGGVNVGGSAFSDPYLNNIFMSYSIGSEQNPVYNLGNDKFGRVTISNASVTTTNNNTKWTQELDFPYRKVKEAINSGMTYTGRTEYNYSSVIIHNILGHGTLNTPCYMYDPNEVMIIAPADGFYEITLEVSGTMDAPSTTFQAPQWYTSYVHDEEMKSPTDTHPHMVTFTKNFLGETPFEIQLVKNYDDNLELIKGKKNVCYMTGDPTQQSYTYQGGSYQGGTYPNKKEWETDFPHQALYASELPTEENGITKAAVVSIADNPNPTATGNGWGGSRTNETYYQGLLGYMHKDNATMPYDPAVNPNFICGFSTMDGGNTVSVIKDGYSYDRGNVDQNHVFANVDGMEQVVKSLSNGNITKTPTTLNKNEYRNAPSNYFSATSTTFTGKVTCCVWLEQNDKLELLTATRDFNGQKYGVTVNYNLDIRAISPRIWKQTKIDPNFSYGMATEFPYLLNLGNFLNNETQISDWIEQIKETFNLTITRDGNNVTINSNTAANLVKSTNAIDLDKKANTYLSDVSSESIDYPSKMGVEWSINTEEFGYVESVPLAHINDSDWEDWGDKGSTVIQLNNPMNEQEEIETVEFSYCWYYPFQFTYGNNNFITSIPVIALNENMVDDLHDANDTMVKDGYSLTQRFWYIGLYNNDALPLASNGNESVHILLTQNYYGNFNLSFKTNEKSIFTEYYNGGLITNTSNYVKLKVYLTAEEYKMLKGGCLVKFDRDLYLCQDISGFDPSGKEECTITLYK